MSAGRGSRAAWRRTAAPGAAAMVALLLLAVVGCSDGGGGSDAAPSPAATPVAVAGSAEQIAHGAYLAKVGNCAGCHTAPGGASMAGGVRLMTPFGAVHAGNLTPDPATGLGRWSADDFHRAMHQGRGRDGRRLVPAFPYTSFTRVARADNDALFAYLRSLPPIVQPAGAHGLRFPYGTQAALAAWQWLYFTPAVERAQAPAGGTERGEYLVRGLGHCGECHAPRNRWGAPQAELIGADMPGERWYAPSLHRSGGPDTDVAETVALLRDGINRHGSAAGPMARVVLDSTQHWQASDLDLAARYLQGLPPQARSEAPVAANPAQLAAGARRYADGCADCHGEQGQGVPGIYPPLAGNPTVTAPSLRNLVQVLRHGGFPASTAGNPRPYGMPPAELSDADTAALLSHLRQSWGNRASAVSELDVLQAR